MREPGKAVSARGDVVDFELIKVKEELKTAPVVVQREAKPGAKRRRKLTERGAVLAEAKKEAVAQPEVVDEPTTPAPKIVRRKNTTQ